MRNDELRRAWLSSFIIHHSAFIISSTPSLTVGLPPCGPKCIAKGALIEIGRPRCREKVRPRARRVRLKTRKQPKRACTAPRRDAGRVCAPARGSGVSLLRDFGGLFESQAGGDRSFAAGRNRNL